MSKVSVHIFVFSFSSLIMDISIHRNRFAAVSKFKVVQLLTCSEQHLVLLPFIRHLLGQNSSANILLQSPPLMMKDTVMSNLKYDISNELRLWLYKLYLNSSFHLQNYVEYRQGLSWLALNELYHPFNPKIKSFLLPSIYQNSESSSATSFSWFNELLNYSELNLSKINGEKKGLFIEGQHIFQLKSFTFHPLQFNSPQSQSQQQQQPPPVTQSQQPPLSQNSRSYLRGFQVINEERYPALALQYVCDENPFYMVINIHSNLSFPVKINKILLIYKKIYAESFRSNFGMLYSIPSEDDNSPLHRTTTTTTAENATETPMKSFYCKEEKEFSHLGKDEFKLILSKEYYRMRKRSEDDIDEEGTEFGDEDDEIVIYPGSQALLFEYFPTSLGEYALDRYYFCMDSITIYNYPILNNLSLIPTQTDRPYSYRDQPLSHEDIQSYFDEYPLIRVVDPEITISPIIQSPFLSPFLQKDYCILKFNILSYDFIEELILYFPSIEFSECIHRYTGEILEQSSFFSYLPSDDGISPVSPHLMVRGTSMSVSHNQLLESSDIMMSNNSSQMAIQALAKPNGNNNNINSGRDDRSTFYTTNGRKPSVANGATTERSRGQSVAVEKNNPHMNKMKFTLQILPFTDWKFYRIDNKTNEQQTLTPSFEYPSSSGYSSLLRLNKVKGNGQICIAIPYIPSLLINSKNSLVSSMNDLFYRCILNYHCQISLKRKLCKIPLQILSQKTLLFGDLVTGKLCLNSLLCNNNSLSMVAQLELVNLYDYPIQLIGYQVIYEDSGYSNNSLMDFKVMTNSQQHGYSSGDEDTDNEGEDEEAFELPLMKDNNITNLPSDPTTGKRKGIVIEKGETYFLNFIGRIKGKNAFPYFLHLSSNLIDFLFICIDNNLKFKISFSFLRMDLVANDAIFQDISFTYDCWINLDQCANKSNPIRLEVKEDQTGTIKKTVSTDTLDGESNNLLTNTTERKELIRNFIGHLGRILIIEGTLSLKLNGNLPKFVIQSVKPPEDHHHHSQYPSITSLAKSIPLKNQQFYQSVQIGVINNYQWLPAGMYVQETAVIEEPVIAKPTRRGSSTRTFPSKTYKNDFIKINLQLKVIPLCIGKISFPKLEVNDNIFSCIRILI
jgi:hypothetical protein